MRLIVLDRGPMSQIIPTPSQAELEAMASEWQQRLRLQDWTVKIQVRRRHHMCLADAHGTCSWELRKKLAAIEIMDPADYDPGSWGWAEDVEKTVVHELLHLHFAPFAAKDDGPDDVAQEQAIDLIARALVAAKREAPPVGVEFQPAGDPDRPAIQVVHVPADSLFDRTVKTP